MFENSGKIYNNFRTCTIITATCNFFTHDLIRQSNPTFLSDVVVINYKTGLELPSFYLFMFSYTVWHAVHGLPLSFHGSCLARKTKTGGLKRCF